MSGSPSGPFLGPQPGPPNGPMRRYIGVGVLAALTLALVLAAVVLLARQDRNAPIRIVAPTIDAPVSPESGQSNTPAPSPHPPRVQVTGAVVNPGVYTLGPDDRIIDAINAAGGSTADADLTDMYLASRVQDEGRYYIPKIGEAPSAEVPGKKGGVTEPEPPASDTATPVPTGPGPGPDGKIDLNLASAKQLEELPGIGPALAAAIVDYRLAEGPFQTVEEIVNYRGLAR